MANPRSVFGSGSGSIHETISLINSGFMANPRSIFISGSIHETLSLMNSAEGSNNISSDYISSENSR